MRARGPGGMEGGRELLVGDSLGGSRRDEGTCRARTTGSVGCAQVRLELWGVEYSKRSPTLRLIGSQGQGRARGRGTRQEPTAPAQA